MKKDRDIAKEKFVNFRHYFRFALGFGLLISINSFAQTDTQGWLQVSPKYHLSEKTDLGALVQWRFGRGNSDQILTNLAVSLSLGSVRVEGGFATLSTTHPFFGSLESRPWIGASTKMNLGSVSWSNRVRTEFRFLSGASGSAIRLRYLTAFKFPSLMEDAALHPILNDEIFLHLNSTTGGPGSGFDQNRFKIGLSWKAGERTNIDFTYMNFVLNQATGDLVLHVPFVNFVLDITPAHEVEVSDGGS